ncbi:MAG: flippase-like domain-containing protein, partial [Chloroflexi bacterium]|nr:flippase-like domain-containing protein [Chloroflexota bacterium]
MPNVLASLKANQSLKRRLLTPKTGIPLVALILVIALLTNKVDIGFSDTWEHITTLNPWWYVLAFVSHYTTFVFRGARWRALIANAHRHGGGPPPSVAYAGRVILMGWFVNSVTWFRMGDAYRAYAYASDTNTS